MSAVTAVSQRYTECGSGVRKWCGGGQDRCFLRCKLNLSERYGYCIIGRLDCWLYGWHWIRCYERRLYLIWKKT